VTRPIRKAISQKYYSISSYYAGYAQRAGIDSFFYKPMHRKNHPYYYYYYYCKSTDYSDSSLKLQGHFTYQI